MSESPESKEICDILNKAIEMEKFGRKFYELLEKYTEDEESKALFKRLAAEEKNHQYLFMEELRQHGGAITPPTDFHPDRQFNRGISEIFEDGPLSALKYAMKVEQRVIDFYSASMNKISNSRVKKFLVRLIDVEKTHLEILNKHLVKYKALIN